MDIKIIKKFAKSKLNEEFIKNHIKYVVKWALKLCKDYPEADEEVVEIAAWLHDVIHPTSGYKGEDHDIASAKVAKEFLKNTDLDERKIKMICHAIETHRTSKPPWPDTIEGKIVFSADNLSHFDNFKFLVKKGGIEWALKKVKRDIESKYMLPKAVEYAKKLMIKNKIDF